MPRSPRVVDDLIARNLQRIGSRDWREGTGLAFRLDVLKIPFSVEERWPHFLDTERLRLDDIWIDPALARGNRQWGFFMLWVLLSTLVNIHHFSTREKCQTTYHLTYRCGVDVGCFIMGGP